MEGSTLFQAQGSRHVGPGLTENNPVSA